MRNKIYRLNKRFDMSYSFDLKKSFFNIKMRKCCKNALLCGMFAFLPSDGNKIRISSEYKELLDYYNSLFRDIIFKDFDINKNGRLKFIEITAPYFTDLFGKINFSYDRIEEIIDFFSRKNCCFSSFLRGIFMTIGSISSPGKAYHLEFRVYNDKNADILLNILKDKDLDLKKSIRNRKPIIYTSSADIIRDFLAEIGAVDFMFDYTNASIEKKLRNDINRHSNCDNANIDRVIDAAEVSARSIEFLRRAGYYDSLPYELKEIAELRLNDLTETLEQLGAKCNPPISKSKAFRRIKKINLIADKYKKEGKI